MADSPSTEELRRIRHTLIWLVLVVAAAGLYDPEVFDIVSDGAYLILLVSFFASVVYFTARSSKPTTQPALRSPEPVTTCG